jgi:hypothetical protein
VSPNFGKFSSAFGITTTALSINILLNSIWRFSHRWAEGMIVFKDSTKTPEILHQVRKTKKTVE